MAVREFSEETLTAAVLQRIEGTPDARLKQVMECAVRHLHAFVREVRPTQAEWAEAIGFLADTGHLCDANRNEFILLSDTLGVSMLVDSINHAKAEAGGLRATESTVLGPFYVEDPPELAQGANIAKPGTPGEPCAVSVSVRGLDGGAIGGAVVDVWEAGGDGFYDVQKDDGVNLRARFRTDREGRLAFRCVKPVSYPVPHDGPVGKLLRATGRHPMRPGHLHFMIEAPGYEPLVTHLFVRGDEYLESDAVFGVKDSLVVDFARAADGANAVRYDFVLKPAAAAGASR